MTETDREMFPDSPTVHFFDPLGEMLGAGDGYYAYRFDDVVKLSGHACPTVAGAFLLTKRAVEFLYRDEVPRRGDIRVILHGGVEEGVNGPISQVLTLLTGAAGANGFQGLGGQHARKGLLGFTPQGEGKRGCVTFERISTGERVTLRYDPSTIPAAPTMGDDLRVLLSGAADDAVRRRFRQAWRERVERILADDGEQTLRRLE